jgi:[ribosomal protein S5]-alanine N-acetyltransferase
MSIAETPRLFLRPLSIQDCEAMCRVLCDPEVMLYSMGKKKPADVRGWIKGCIADYSKLGFGLWAVVMKNTHRVIGYSGLTKSPDINGKPEIEIGFRLARSFWSRGYGTECAAAVRDFAFGPLSIPRLIALVDPGNTASLRVIEKIGMIYEREIMLPGYDHADRLYAAHQISAPGVRSPA